MHNHHKELCYEFFQHKIQSLYYRPCLFPQETALGALGLYVSNQSITQFQPMNINFGIIPPLDHRVKGKRNKNAELSQRSLAVIDQLKEEVLK